MSGEFERDLVKRAKKDPETFGLIYDKYYQPIFGYILRRTANVALAEDLTAQTFLKALKNLWRFRWQNVTISAWLYRIATNEVNSYYRKKKGFKNVSLEEAKNLKSDINVLEEIQKAEEELQKEKDFLLLHKKIAKLKPKYQTVIALRFFEKKKVSEIAQILGKPEGTIKAQIHRALRQLKKLLEENETKN
ncbi:sigma-70 family RNA polymerase sigma factor [bacterium]|nr:sigma-70 family RNA polymerase sigma factor [bacterium]